MNRKKLKKKVLHNIYIFFKNMENLQYIPNNILTIFFFKQLTKYKNDYQQYLNYIYIYIYELYYASYCISLIVSMHMHGIMLRHM